MKDFNYGLACNNQFWILRNQMKKCCKTGDVDVSLSFLGNDKVILWWVKGSDALNIELGIHQLNITHKDFVKALRAATKFFDRKSEVKHVSC